MALDNKRYRFNRRGAVIVDTRKIIGHDEESGTVRYSPKRISKTGRAWRVTHNRPIPHGKV